MKTQLSSKDWERLSAYLDGQLNERERQQVEQMLRTRSEARQALKELRQTRHLLRQAPRVKAPRNFTLTPAMVSPTPGHPTPMWRFAPALAAFLIALVVLLEFLPPITPTTPEMVGALQEAPVAKSLTTLEETPTPVILYWGGPPAPPAAAGAGGGGAPEAMSGSTADHVMGETGNGGYIEGESSGPILGIPEPQERGKIYTEAPAVPVSPPAFPSRITPLLLRRVVQGILVLAALAMSIGFIRYRKKES